MLRQYVPNIVEEREFWIENAQEEPEAVGGIKMEVGIEDYLHIEFEYDKAKLREPMSISLSIVCVCVCVCVF